MNGIYTPPEGGTVSLMDQQGNGQGTINAGDRVVVKDRDGRVVSERKLDAQEAREINFRSNVVSNSEATNPPWRFTTDNVEIRNNQLDRSETRTYRDGNNMERQETVLQRNQYWEVIQRAGPDGKLFKFMKLRPEAQPSEAVNDIFNNRGNYRFDCATPMRLINLKATLDTVGTTDFNRAYQGLSLNGSYDSHDRNGDTVDAGFHYRGETARAGNPDGAIPGREYTRFDPRTDRLQPGEWRYFERPGNAGGSGNRDRDANQGWNAMYVGPGQDGRQRFWLVGYGTLEVAMDQNGNVTGAFDSRGRQVANPFGGEYLSSMRGTPDHTALSQIDRVPGQR